MECLIIHLQKPLKMLKEESIGLNLIQLPQKGTQLMGIRMSHLRKKLLLRKAEKENQEIERRKRSEYYYENRTKIVEERIV